MKFRAWDIANRTMLSWEDIMDMSARKLFGEYDTSKSYETESFETKEFEVMCYTGKQDISGTEVYEGDIIEDAGGRKLQIKYGKYWSYCPVSKCNMDSVGFFAESKNHPKMPIGPLSEYSKVVGNIYECPDLLA